MPSESSHRDPNRAPTEAITSEHVTPIEVAPLGEGIAVRIATSEHACQTPPLLSPLFQAQLAGTGTDPCPLHNLDHGMRDPECDHCKRASGPLIKQRIKGNRHLPVFTFDLSGPHPHRVSAAQYLLVCVWCLGDMRLVWASRVENRQSATVLPCLQSSFEDLRSLTRGSRPPILRLHSDKAKECLCPMIRAYLQQRVRQTMKCGSDPAGNGLAERWVGIVRVRATALLADVRLPPEYWSYACRWVAYVHTHRVFDLPIDNTLLVFGDCGGGSSTFEETTFENRCAPSAEP